MTFTAGLVVILVFLRDFRSCSSFPGGPRQQRPCILRIGQRASLREGQTTRHRWSWRALPSGWLHDFALPWHLGPGGSSYFFSRYTSSSRRRFFLYVTFSSFSLSTLKPSGISFLPFEIQEDDSARQSPSADEPLLFRVYIGVVLRARLRMRRRPSVSL